MGRSAEIDGPLNEFDRYLRTIEVQQGGIDWLIGVAKECLRGVLVRKICLKLRPDQCVRMAADERSKVAVDRNDGGAFTNQESLKGGVGKAAGPFELTPTFAHLDRCSAKREHNHEKASQCGGYRDRRRWYRGTEMFKRRIKGDLGRTHGDKVEPAEGHRQQQAAKDFPSQPIPAQSERQGGGRRKRAHPN